MPPTRFRSDLHKVKEAGLEQVCQLANSYSTSKLATARRFVDLLGDPMAVVQTNDGGVSQNYRRNDFPTSVLRRVRQCTANPSHEAECRSAKSSSFDSLLSSDRSVSR